MDVPESHRDLLDADVAALTTIGGDGIPQSSLVWFLFEDGVLKLSLNDHRQKTRNLLKRPQVSLLIADGPWRYMDVRGLARTAPDPDYAFADRVAEKYDAESLRRHDGPGVHRLVVTIEPTQVYAVNMRA